MLTNLEWHNKHHRLACGTPPKVESCRRCDIAKAKCEGKIDYKSRACADKAALGVNLERRWFPGSCVLPYRCRYCVAWHLTSATRMEDTRRVEKMRQRWLRKTGLRDSLETGGWELRATG